VGPTFLKAEGARGEKSSIGNSAEVEKKETLEKLDDMWRAKKRKEKSACRGGSSDRETRSDRGKEVQAGHPHL